MKKIEAYVHQLFKEIPDSDSKRNMEEEIIQNLEEKVMDLMASGKEEEDAINKAIVDFGDIEDIKRELRQHLTTNPTKSKMRLIFSLWATGLIISLVLFMNFYYTPNVIWFVYPVFAIIWWPLVMFYLWYEQRNQQAR
ncbi:hypothetical protein HZI73_19710 [Vallitalea pronyensis]|uniref:2TM domain-containing protein n=1 Tax=Vallitalea pronyensis TaxID=1348613 RepID=A0A8J8SHZ7_9FIRM|nr:permease prefix domain 1-containing protein [Vallitalea pronyensis]QUI24385.1 hypothetical protein HZI73_19710 [Vallitalea pronyensis]